MAVEKTLVPPKGKDPILLNTILPKIEIGEWDNKKPQENRDGKEKTDIQIQEAAIQVNKIQLQKKKTTKEESAEQEDIGADNFKLFAQWDAPKKDILIPSTDNPQDIFSSKIPPPIPQLSDFQRLQQTSQKELQEQESKTAKSIEWKMDAELKSVTDTGKIDQLDPKTQNKIRTEVVRAAISVDLLSNDKKKEILSTMKWADGEQLDMSKVDFQDLTLSQKDFILNSPAVQGMAQKAVEKYKALPENATEEQKKEFLSQLPDYWLRNLDALSLSQIHPDMKKVEYPADTHIGIIQRVLAESTFWELQNTLWDGLRWDHVPDGVKREIVFDSFAYDPAKNNRSIELSINEAKSTLSHLQIRRAPGESKDDFIKRRDEQTAKQPDESSKELATRIQKQTGISSTNLESLSLEAQKSWLSPMMRMLADFFWPIGAALGIPFWQKYMGERFWDDDFDDSGTDDWSSDAKGKEANIPWWVLKSNKAYLDSGKGLKLEGGSYENQANSASEAILAHKEKYQKVSEATWVPWELIGAIHFRESSLNFNTYLHNGDPLGKPTVRVPARIWPFTNLQTGELYPDQWERAAIHALKMKWELWFKNITQTNQLEQVAGYAEKYNGFGYRDNGVSSAYVWAGTEAYTGWMYVADGVFSRTKKDPRPWVMAIISKLIPDSVKSETKKRTPDISTPASTAGAFKKDFTSVGFKKNPKTWTTLCSQTAREDIYKVLGRNEDVPMGNANVVHDIYRDGGRFEGMVWPYTSSFFPPENANVADVSLTSKSVYGHRVTAYKSTAGWMVLDPYNGWWGKNPQPWESYVKKNDVCGVAFYQKTESSI